MFRIDSKVDTQSEEYKKNFDHMTKIVAEYKQGKYDEAGDDIRAREERLNAWLVEMGF